MPIVKLSRKCYETFGDELTAELVGCPTQSKRASGTRCAPGAVAFGRPEAKLEDFREEFALLRTDVPKEISAAKVDLIKWSVGLGVPVALALIGLYFRH
jgi:hypothetical protein